MRTTIRIGNVSDIYPDDGMVSVTYPQYDDATSGKLPLLSFTDEYKMPKVGDRVVVLHFENGAQEGIVLGHYWNEKNKCPKSGAQHWWKSLCPPYTDNPEKATMFYDDESETLTITAPKIVLVATDGQTTIDSGTLTLLTESTTNTGLYTGEQDVIAESSISGAHHTHTGVHGETSPPN